MRLSRSEQDSFTLLHTIFCLSGSSTKRASSSEASRLTLGIPVDGRQTGNHWLINAHRAPSALASDQILPQVTIRGCRHGIQWQTGAFPEQLRHALAYGM